MTAAPGERGDAPDRHRLLQARARLLHELAGIAVSAETRSLDRCPYRAREDRCTFTGGCRNQRRERTAGVRCAGGRLDATPAPGHRAGSPEGAREGDG